MSEIQKKNVAILGSTGSIGKSSLEVLSNFPEQFNVQYLTINKNIDGIVEQIQQFKPRGVVVLDEVASRELKTRIPDSTEILCGEEGLLEIVQRDDVDIVISSLVGFAGLKPTMKAIEAKKKIALANKETLVVAGEIIMNLVRQHGVALLPVDSEHSAILQCLVGEDNKHVAKIILTASGGPFRTKSKDELKHVTIEQALNHPNWKMGSKITIDSATLMNKGLEVIEAHWLFGVMPDKIDVVIHPQSIIHSMVEFVDGSVKAQLGMPDMKIPIQYALTYPERAQSAFARVSFPQLKEMTFFEPDREKFPCLQLAFNAIKTGGTMPAVMNAANEIAVEKFLDDKITFLRIPQLISKAMGAHVSKTHPTIDDIIDADVWARHYVKSLVV